MQWNSICHQLGIEGSCSETNTYYDNLIRLRLFVEDRTTTADYQARDEYEIEDTTEVNTVVYKKVEISSFGQNFIDICTSSN